MKIKRFTAKSMREAIRMVREEQGPDAVILSNRRVPGGIEVVAATDYDAALAQQALRAAAPLEPPPTSPNKPKSPPRPAAPASAAAAAAPGDPAPQRALASAELAPAHLASMQQELGSVRRLLEEQISGMRWSQLKRTQPRRVAVLKALANLGLDPDVAGAIADEFPQDADAERALHLPQSLLARRIPITKPDPIMKGGVVALVGPTGAGKTTTIAKLAARYARQHRPRDIALVTLDHYRIGAQEQLHSFGRLLGVPVHSVAPDRDLAAMLDQLGDHGLVLVDTAGMSHRDRGMQHQLARLAALGPRLRSWVVLAASSADPDDTVRRYAALKPEGAVLTKFDEARSVGAQLSAVIRHKLPLAYVAHGQRVPEDLYTAHADRLVLCATQMARSAPRALDEDDLALRFARPQSLHNHNTQNAAHA